MKPLKADLEMLVDIVTLLIKQGQMGRVHRGGRGPVGQGLGAGKPRGMDAPQGPEGREWEDYAHTDKKRKLIPGSLAETKALKAKYFNQALQHAEEQAGRKATKTEIEDMWDQFEEANLNTDWQKRKREDARKEADTSAEDTKDYDPSGKHIGPRGGHYFKPGERETKGTQVDVVQAPRKGFGRLWQ